MLKANITEPSNSPWAAPIVLVKKRGGITRFCVDFRMLNNVTIKDAYSLPRITRHAFWHQILLNLDLARGYSQVAMDESDEVKTAFATHKGLFQFKVLPFGLSNSPVAFEGLMEAVLSGLQWEKCLVYLDDIITFGATFEDTLKNLTVIFDRLRTSTSFYYLKAPSYNCTSVIASLNNRHIYIRYSWSCALADAKWRGSCHCLW